MRCDGLRSSHTTIFLEPPISVVRTLVGLSQLRWTWAMALPPSGRVR